MSIIIYGPAGCGKTRNADALCRFYKMTEVMDDEFDPYPRTPAQVQKFKAGTKLFLTGAAPPADIPESSRRVIRFDSAMEEMTLHQKRAAWEELEIMDREESAARIWAHDYNTHVGDLVGQVFNWAEATFPDRTDVSMYLKIYGEVAEMIESDGSEDEIADMFILLMDYAKRKKVDIVTAVMKKLVTNRKRTWVISKEGVASHAE